MRMVKQAKAPHLASFTKELAVFPFSILSGLDNVTIKAQCVLEVMRRILSYCVTLAALCTVIQGRAAQQTENFNSGASAAADGWVDFNDRMSGTNSSGVPYTVNYGFSSTAY